MFQVNSITLQGKDNRVVQFTRAGSGVAIRLPVVGTVRILSPDALPGDMVSWVMPLLYGTPVNGKFDCSDADTRKIVSEIERLF